MCGIFGYVGKKNAAKIAIDGLKRLEYRGYDSAGIAGIADGRIVFFKEVGKVNFLEKKVQEAGVFFSAAIAQTRWATHGKPSQVNAHPHLDEAQNLALVHNGIIENYLELRQQLKKQGVTFISDTDTEVIAHLIASFYQGNLVEAVRHAISLLKGTFALAIIHRLFPQQIIVAAHESPLVIGIGEHETFVASDSHAFASYTKKVIYLENSEIAVLEADKREIYDKSRKIIEKKVEILSTELEEATKGSYQHYTLKEIFEQPNAIRRALEGRLDSYYGTASFSELNIDVSHFLSIERILILGCGTSWHAAYVASYMIEELARIPVQVEISSEYRYKNPVVSPNTLVMAISQSGETADTLAAVRELKAKGSKILALCNVPGSTLVRESDYTLFLKAGPEIGVCSTKAFTNQVVVLFLFTLVLARMRNLSKSDGQNLIQHLLDLPDQVKMVLDQAEAIKKIADQFAKYENFFYLGRHYMFPTALEGALKLKEIAYINANGYPSGEMKHGPIALINENCPTMAFCANQLTYEKMLSNLMEVKARNGIIIAIANEGSLGLEEISDYIIRLPFTIDLLAPITSTVAAQLFAYYTALRRGTEIDQPKNLAKSVTVP